MKQSTPNRSVLSLITTGISLSIFFIFITAFNTPDFRANIFFQVAGRFPLSDYPLIAVVGDFNADGNIDIATTTAYPSYTVSILLGNGDGTFRQAINYAGGGKAIITGDFNNDSKPDLATTTSLLLGNGNGTFRNPLSLKESGKTIIAGDFNADNKLDLVMTQDRDGDNNVLVTFGNGDGTFQLSVNYNAGDGLRALSAADFNLDGKTDLAVINEGGNSISILLGNGNGTFQGALKYGAGIRPYSITVGDYNADGKPDIAAGHYWDNSVSILLGNSDGTFMTSVSYEIGKESRAIANGDFNNDGKLDVVATNFYANDISILWGNGDGTFRTGMINYVSGSASYSIVTGDFNKDGKLDMAGTALNVLGIPNKGGYIYILLSNDNDTFHAASSYKIGGHISSLAGGDFNKDGKKDLLTFKWEKGKPGVCAIIALLGNNDGQFQAPLATKVECTFTINESAAADFNGDGKIDLAGTYHTPVGDNGYLSIFLGNGDGTFQSGIHISSIKPYAITIGDFNRDSKTDIAAAVSNGVSILLGNGDGTFQTPKNYSAIRGEFIVTVDFNSDGKLDIATSSSVLMGNGDGTFQSAITHNGAGGVITTNDLNGDEKSDLIIVGESGNISILLGNGNGTFRTPIINNDVVECLNAIASADLNNDKKTDVIATTCNEEILILKGNGDGKLQPPIRYVIGRNNIFSRSSIVISDFNGDGGPDIAVMNGGSGNISIFLNTTYILP